MHFNVRLCAKCFHTTDQRIGDNFKGKCHLLREIEASGRTFTDMASYNPCLKLQDDITNAEVRLSFAVQTML
jgi:hypothetical protein